MCRTLQKWLWVLFMNILTRTMNISSPLWILSMHAASIQSNRKMNTKHTQAPAGFPVTSCTQIALVLCSASIFVSTFVYVVSTFVIKLLRKFVYDFYLCCCLLLYPFAFIKHFNSNTINLPNLHFLTMHIISGITYGIWGKANFELQRSSLMFSCWFERGKVDFTVEIKIMKMYSLCWELYSFFA